MGRHKARDDAWLWGEALLSDITLQIYPAGHPSWLPDGPEPVAQLLLHAAVLASVSPGYFRGHIRRLLQGKGQPPAAVVQPSTPEQQQQQEQQGQGQQEQGQQGQQMQQAQPAPEHAAEHATPRSTCYAARRGAGGSSGADKGGAGSSRGAAASGPSSGSGAGPSVAARDTIVLDRSDNDDDDVPLSFPRTYKRPGPEAEQHQPAAKRLQSAAAAAAAGSAHKTVLRLTCYPGEPRSVIEAVLRHAYTGELPDDPTLLAWMMWRADYLDMAATVAACLSKLRHLSRDGRLSVQALVVICSLPALQTDSQATVQRTVTKMTLQVLSTQLCEVCKVLLDQQLLDQFVQLPFQLLKQWAGQDSLRVDSENTMAVLITAWYNHQLDSPRPPTDEECEELSALVCLGKLTPSFHLQAVPHLEWYVAPAGLPQQHAMARAITAMAGESSQDHIPELASGGVARHLSGPTTAEQQVSLTRQQLEQLWSDRTLQLEGSSSSIYYAGFCFTVELHLKPTLTPKGEQWRLGFYLTCSWPSPLVQHGVGDQVPNPVTAVRVSLQVGTHSFAVVKEVITPSADKARGFANVAEKAFTRADQFIAFMASHEITVTLSEI